MKIDKIEVISTPRKLQANWTLDKLSDIEISPPKLNRPLTRDEEADLIIQKLKTPPKSASETLIDLLSDELVKEISALIDAELLQELMKN